MVFNIFFNSNVSIMTYYFTFLDRCFTESIKASLIDALLLEDKTIKSGLGRINTAIWYIFTLFHTGFL